MPNRMLRAGVKGKQKTHQTLAHCLAVQPKTVSIKLTTAIQPNFGQELNQNRNLTVDCIDQRIKLTMSVSSRALSPICFFLSSPSHFKSKNECEKNALRRTQMRTQRATRKPYVFIQTGSISVLFSRLLPHKAQQKQLYCLRTASI